MKNSSQCIHRANISSIYLFCPTVKRQRSYTASEYVCTRNHAKLCILSLICLHIAKERPVKRGEKKNCNPNETKKISLSAKKESFFLSIAQKATNWNKKTTKYRQGHILNGCLSVLLYIVCMCAYLRVLLLLGTADKFCFFSCVPPLLCRLCAAANSNSSNQ